MIDSIKQHQATEPRFLVAKYVPDLRRMEPRNIGIILWIDGDVCCRFLSSEDVSFVNDSETYSRWIRYWNKQIEKDSVSIPRAPEVLRSDPGYLDALKATQKGNYILYEGGRLLEELDSSKIDDATEFLFEQVVATRKPKADLGEGTSEKLFRLSRNAFEELDLWHHPNFQKSSKGFDVPCYIHGVWKVLNFNNAIANGSPQEVFHRVLLDLEINWESAVFRFEKLAESGKVKKDHCAAIVSATDEQLENENIQKNLSVLSDLAEIANVEKYDEAIDILSSVAAV